MRRYWSAVPDADCGHGRYCYTGYIQGTWTFVPMPVQKISKRRGEKSAKGVIKNEKIYERLWHFSSCADWCRGDAWYGWPLRLAGGTGGGRNFVINHHNAYAQEYDVCEQVLSVEQTDVLSIVEGDDVIEGGYASEDWETGWEGLYDIEDAFDFDEVYQIWKGNVAKYQLGTDIEDLDIELGGGSFTTIVSDDDNFYVEAEGVHKFQGFVEDNTLYIKSTSTSRGGSQKGEVTLYVPENYYFEEVEIDVGAGALWFSNLNAQEASLEVGAGSIALNDPKVQELDVSIGAGKIDMTGMEGTVLNNADVECAMGNVEIGLVGSENDFNYYLEGHMGSIQVGDSGYISGGFSQKRTIDNRASKEMEIECSMGNITIWFMD